MRPCTLPEVTHTPQLHIRKSLTPAGCCFVAVAADLPKKDAIGKNDPYAAVLVDGMRLRTATVSGGGGTPKWGDGRGECLVWSLSSAISAVEIIVLDEDIGSKDDLIGSATVDVGGEAEGLWTRDEHLQLQNGKGKTAGTVHVLLQSWDPSVDEEPELPPMRLLRCTVFHALNLPRMDTFGATDPYVTIEVDGKTVRTTTAVDGGANARWGAGESFDIECVGPPKHVDVRCFDEDIDMDDEIGKGRIDLAAGAMPADKAWYREEMVPLRNRTKRAMGKKPKISLSLQWFPMPPEPRRRTVAVTVLAAQDLDSMDLGSANDVYVEFEIMADHVNVQRTTTILDGGGACEWNGGEGETLLFDRFECGGVPCMEARVWDADKIGSDDLIGTAVLNLRDKAADDEWLITSWFPISRKGKHSGEVHLRVAWEPEPPEPRRRGVRVTVLAARDLPKADLFGVNDPYCQVCVDETAARTSVVDGGGAAPSWGDGEMLEFFPCVSGIPTMVLKCFDEDVGSADDELGVCTLNLRGNDADKPWQEEGWYALRKNNGKAAGEIHAAISWEPEPPEPRRRGVRVTVLAARDLPSMDLVGDNVK